MAEITFKIGLGQILPVLRELGAGRLPNTAQAVQDATLLAQRAWLQAASGVEVTFRGKTFSVRRRSGAYARSISEGVEYPADGNDLLGRVSADTQYADAIEQGTPPHDMKPGLLGGGRSRVAKDGSRYVIIPFRHNTPGASATGQAMPQEVYAQAKGMAMSHVTGTRPDVNGKGQPVTRNTYQWGGRLKLMDEMGWRSRIRPIGREYEHTTSIFNSMVRMGGKGASSGYYTFRIVSDRSAPNSWWSRGTEPKPISEAVAETVTPRALAIIRAGFEADLAVLSGD